MWAQNSKLCMSEQTKDNIILLMFGLRGMIWHFVTVQAITIAQNSFLTHLITYLLIYGS